MESGLARNARHPHPFFWKCVKRKGFKSFVLKVCETKGLADAFLRNCINLKGLHGSEGSFPTRPEFSIGSRCSLPSYLRTSRTTISGLDTRTPPSPPPFFLRGGKQGT